jgi:hypothetical protein
MRIPQPGNGSGKFDVGVHDMGGWVHVIAGGTAPQDGNLQFYLARRLSHWLRENAHLRLLCVVPISKDGNEDGKIVEHRDVLQTVPEKSANGNGLF